MEKFITLRSTAIPLNIENVDTDQIIPARFLKATDKKGFGDNVFRDWRYKKDGSVNTSFVLNNSDYKGSILVAGNNFGCGSSREHAAWAIEDYGIKAIISTQFADIFKGNALNNNIIPIELKPNEIDEVKKFQKDNDGAEIIVNVESQTCKISDEQEFKFEIDTMKKTYIIENTNELDFILKQEKEIREFEKNKIS